MTEKHDESPLKRAVERVDEEFAGKRGKTVAETTPETEAHPEMNPQDYGELAKKTKLEADADGEGNAITRGLKELDRDVSGEYEARQDPDAPR